jgi:hypothetical protein
MADTKKAKGADGRRHSRRPIAGFSLVSYKTQAASAYARRKNIGEAVLDISAGGLRLRVSEPLLKGDSVTIEIKELATGDVFHARGDVRWAETREENGKPCYFCGLQFVEIFTAIGKREKFFYGNPGVLQARPVANSNTQIRDAKTSVNPMGMGPVTTNMHQPVAAVEADGRRSERFQIDDYVVNVFRTGLLSSVGLRKNLATDVIDIGRGGACAICIEKLTVGTKVAFTLHLNKFADTFEGEAEVIWVKEGMMSDGLGFFTGLQFIALSPERRKLIDYMMSWFTSYQAKYKAARSI